MDLEEHISQLIDQLRVITCGDRIGKLIRLLDRVGNDRELILPAVPWALDPEATGDLVETCNRFGVALR